MVQTLAYQWQSKFWAVVQQPDYSKVLKESGLQGNLSAWTSALTEVVVTTCQTMGWQASAKGHSLDLLPVRTSEFLSMDVMAFPKAAKPWQLPIAVMELENNQERIAYSLWKVLCIRVQLRIVFCYCDSASERSKQLNYLRREVIQTMSTMERQQLNGQTLVVVGSREEATTFPYGFFKRWELEKNTATFALM